MYETECQNLLECRVCRVSNGAVSGVSNRQDMTRGGFLLIKAGVVGFGIHPFSLVFAGALIMTTGARPTNKHRGIASLSIYFYRSNGTSILFGLAAYATVCQRRFAFQSNKVPTNH